MIVIPTFNDTSSRFTQNINLDGGLYNLYIYWNQRAELWFLDIGDSEGNPILTGRLLSPNYPIFNNYKAYNLPKGEIYLIDTKDDLINVELTFENLGDRYQLVFYTDAEIEEFTA